MFNEVAYLGDQTREEVEAEAAAAKAKMDAAVANWRELQRQMFNESAYPGAPSAGCGPGQVQDYDPETGRYLPGCVDLTPAYAYTSPGHPAGTTTTVLGGLSTTSMILLAGGAVFVLMMLGGRR